MAKPGFRQRFVNPVLTVFVVAGVSFVGYFGSRYLDNDLLHQTMAGIFGTTYFLSIAFGTLYVFTTAHVRGATLSERILASVINPFIWMTKEVFRLSASHPFPECLYWYFNPLNVWLIFLMLFQMGIATLIARSILKRRGKAIKVFTIAPIAVIVGSVFFVISLYAWGKGENVYVIFLKGYRFFFGPGL